jgi:hypothetical protein
VQKLFENAANKPPSSLRENRAAADGRVERQAIRRLIFRTLNLATLLIFELTQVIMALHNRLCKLFFTNFAEWQ